MIQAPDLIEVTENVTADYPALTESEQEGLRQLCRRPLSMLFSGAGEGGNARRVADLTDGAGHLKIPEHVIGSLQIPGGRRLVIRPKSKVLEASLTQVLLAALEQDMNLHGMRGADMSVKRGVDLADLMGALYLNQLHALFRRGLSRDYVEREENLAAVRGRILLVEQLRQQSRGSTRVACRHDKYTFDVSINRVLMCACRCARMAARGHRLRTRLKVAAGRLGQEVTAGPVKSGDVRRLLAVLPRTHAHYRPALSLARIILEHMYLGEILGDGKSKSPGLLIYTPRLYELYVQNLVARAAERLGLGHETQGSHECRALEPLTREDGNWPPIINQPDNLVGRPGKAMLVIDAKYIQNMMGSRVGRDLQYQTLRYRLHFKAPVALVFPADSGWMGHPMQNLERLRFPGPDVILWGLHLQAKSVEFATYDQFMEHGRNQICQLIQAVEGTLPQEGQRPFVAARLNQGLQLRQEKISSEEKGS